MLWTEYDFVSQSQNWSGTHSSAADNNEHKLIQSSWLSGGFQYFFNNSWGISAVVPYANRIVTAQEDGDDGPMTTKWWGLGDIRVNGYYTGFSPDMSTGVNLGIKVPSGDWHKSGIDRDNQIGTGSTDNTRRPLSSPSDHIGREVGLVCAGSIGCSRYNTSGL